jgi:hypothetical protein
MFKLLALCRGWREAHDADDGTLVVWHDVLGITTLGRMLGSSRPATPGGNGGTLKDASSRGACRDACPTA